MGQLSLILERPVRLAGEASPNDPPNGLGTFQKDNRRWPPQPRRLEPLLLKCSRRPLQVWTGSGLQPEAPAGVLLPSQAGRGACPRLLSPAAPAWAASVRGWRAF